MLYSGDCGHDRFRYVFRKFLLTNRVEAGQEAGKPTDDAALTQKGAEGGVLWICHSQPAPTLLRGFEPLPSRLSSPSAFLSSLWASQSHILSVSFCTCFSVSLSFSDSSCFCFWLCLPGSF